MNQETLDKMAAIHAANLAKIEAKKAKINLNPVLNSPAPAVAASRGLMVSDPLGTAIIPVPVSPPAAPAAPAAVVVPVVTGRGGHVVSIKKDYHGAWVGETKATVNGVDYLITTYKNSRGFVCCSAQSGIHKEHGFSYIVFQDASYKLYSLEGKATEKLVRAVHESGLLVFDSLPEIQKAVSNPVVDRYEFIKDTQDVLNVLSAAATDSNETPDIENILSDLGAGGIAPAVGLVAPVSYKGFQRVAVKNNDRGINTVAVPVVAPVRVSGSSSVVVVETPAAVLESPKVSGFWIEEYSEKAIVLRGDGRKVKEKLTGLGGSFNSRLRGGCGWVFPKTKREKLELFLTTL